VLSGIPLRRRLFALIAAGIVPLAVTSGIGLYVLQRQQSAQTERVGLELARSVANAVDAELRSTISILETLATAPALDEGDVAAFRDRARRILDTRPEWAAILLTDPAGRPLADTREAGEAPLPDLADRASFDRVAHSAAPVVGGLAPHAGGWLFAVRVPVRRGDRARYILTALVTPGAIRDVLTRQQVPEDWVISIVDAQGLRVARSKAHDENVGGHLSDTAQRVVSRGGDEGIGVSYTLEGERSLTPYSRIRSAGWIAVLGIPTAVVDAAGYRSLAVYGGGILLSLLLATIGAVWVARTITRPMADLRAAAEALGRRDAPRLPRTSIQEIRDVGAALKNAADALARGETEREELLRKERQAREAAQAADRAKDEFMAVLSHELRTPLNAVYGWARMLQTGALRDEAAKARARDAIVRNADVQVQLIDDLLDLSRITTGKMRLEIRRVDMADVVRGAIDAVRPAAEARRIRLEAAIDPAVGSLAGDAARLQQVVWNLLMNAVKFTPPGGDVRLELGAAGPDVRVVVRDNGQGIAPDVLPHVFERFRQGDSSTTRAHGGLGLGLALVRHLVELHGGVVTAESAGVGAGATFTVLLPAASGAPAAPAGIHDDVPRLDGVTGMSRLDGVRVLVVDDDGEGLALAEAILVRAGAQVRTCTSAADGVDGVRTWRPDVVISDIEMPREDGYSLIGRIRALTPDEGGLTPAVALTAYGRPQDRVRALAAGFNMHLPKPVDPGELTTIVAGLTAGPRTA
jgi:signal transduction histidine kinase/CheY-like chemotaxis protein